MAFCDMTHMIRASFFRVDKSESRFSHCLHDALISFLVRSTEFKNCSSDAGSGTSDRCNDSWDQKRCTEDSSDKRPPPTALAAPPPILAPLQPSLYDFASL